MTSHDDKSSKHLPATPDDFDWEADILAAIEDEEGAADPFPERQPAMEELCPSYDPPHQWRTSEQNEFLKSARWQAIRRQILDRDDYTCRYCEFRGNYYMVIDHIDGNPECHDLENLQTICSWCNATKHAGLAITRGQIQLFEKQGHTQVEVIHETRRLRGLGMSDDEILEVLNLEEPVEFAMNHSILQEMVAFVVNGGPRSIGQLTVSNWRGSFLREDEENRRGGLPAARENTQNQE